MTTNFHFQMARGVVGRGMEIYAIDIVIYPGQTLDILVQNEGRSNGWFKASLKGILGNATLDGYILRPWAMFPLKLPHFPPKNPTPLGFSSNLPHSDRMGLSGFYAGRFHVDEALDTFLDMDGWRNVRVCTFEHLVF